MRAEYNLPNTGRAGQMPRRMYRHREAYGRAAFSRRGCVVSQYVWVGTGALCGTGWVRQRSMYILNFPGCGCDFCEASGANGERRFTSLLLNIDVDIIDFILFGRFLLYR